MVFNKLTKKEEESSNIEEPGLYVIDGYKILYEGDADPLMIATSIGGINGLLKVDYNSSRLYFLTNYDICTMVPESHKNTF